MNDTILDPDTAAPQAAPAAADDAHEYAIVEIFGHRRLAGRILEVERFGAKLLRIDVPTAGDFAKGFTTQHYGGAAIFSMTPTDLATVMKLNKPHEPARLTTFVDNDDDGDDGDGVDNSF